MTAPLTLPGTIPGLLRRGSPVIHALLWSGVVHEVAESSAVVCTTCYAMRDLALDLTDATGRAHAAWWLGAHYGITTRPDWIRKADGWELWAYTGGCWFADFTEPLTDLNPNDPRLLPDGSRWVDAEALRLVCLHVAGLPS